jgi:hypothetical protein
MRQFGLLVPGPSMLRFELLDLRHREFDRHKVLH